MTKKEFDKRWKTEIDKLCCQYLSSGTELEQAKKGAESFFGEQNIWQYNQIIGYIQIDVSAQDVFFDIYCSSDNRYYEISAKAFYESSHNDWNTLSNLGQER